MAFKARTTAPSANSNYWKHTSAGGMNECIKIKGGSALPNCVGYALGRFYEIMGKRPKLSRRNAELWFGNAADGAGHVAIVEKIYDDGSFLVSQSGYGSKRFWTSKIPAYCSLKCYTEQGTNQDVTSYD